MKTKQDLNAVNRKNWGPILETKEATEHPDVEIKGEGQEFKNDLDSILYSLLLICRETKQGNLKIVIKDGIVCDITTEIYCKK